nr:hypothetical protein [Tanacetum cinerariifolium]
MVIQNQSKLGEDEAVHKELGDSLVRAAITASSLGAEQDNGGGPGCQETIWDNIAQTEFENVSKQSNDSLLARESFDNEESLGNDASKQGRIDAIDADEEITLVFAAEQEVISAATTTTATITTVDDITLAQALMEIKSIKPKEKRIVIQELVNL